MPFLGRGLGSGKRGGIYTVIPPTGNVSTVFSIITPSASTVVSGASITLTLQLKDANNVNLSSAAGATIVPTKSGGTATGTLSSVTDNGNGTVSWTYTGVLKGTAQTLGATINGVALSSTLPTCVVTVGAINRTVSTLIVESSSAVEGGSNVIARLQAKDAAGNNLTSGGSTVVISHSGGTSVISISSVTDVGDGTYTANITPTSPGTATTMSATIGGLAVTTSMPTFTVGATFLFRSDWSTATGGGDAALRDTGKSLPWTESRNNITDLSVISASGLGFPAGMTNVLRHTFALANPTRAAFVTLLNGFAAPAVGTTLYIRFYFRQNELNEGASGQDNSHHNFEGDNSGGIKSVLLVHPGNNLDSTFPVRFAMYEATYPNNYLNPNTDGEKLTKGVVYRFEVALTILNANYLTPRFRLYGADDSTLLFPDGATGYTKMVNLDGVNITTLPATTWPYSNISWLRNWELGNNGGSMGPFSADCYDYFGGVLFKNTDWCGPYNASTG